MGIRERLTRVVKAYVNAWLGRSLAEFESDDLPWPDEETGPGGPAPAGARREPDARLQRCYNRLEIPIGSDLATVRKAWKEMMKRYHPDRHGNDPEKLATATRLCQELTEAYLELSRFLKT
ncbi:MAG TPA: J domain-containing protein [Candidatus Ozemobacteraceae bacterium]|nr:J domain-containing protein [Candidatus Ozemobacteraceae bacterium]